METHQSAVIKKQEQNLAKLQKLSEEQKALIANNDKINAQQSAYIEECLKNIDSKQGLIAQHEMVEEKQAAIIEVE